MKGNGCRGTSPTGLPPDAEARRLIATALDRNLLVEAAAGTGKTSAMIDRMLALLRSGSCRHIRHLAAVTFTRKAAAEIRSRFLAAAEDAWRKAEDQVEKERLKMALENSEQCFIGTIHSFCARILRERPLEAGLGLEFREIDDLEDSQLREEAWEEFWNRLLMRDEKNLLGRLEERGLRLYDLKAAFLSYADFPDVEEWPRPRRELDEELLGAARRKLEKYLDHMRELAPRLPSEAGNDKLIPELRRLPRVISHYRLDETVELMEALEELDHSVDVVQRVWQEKAGISGEDAKMEKARWENFRNDVVLPTLARWREYRYPLCLEVLEGAQRVYNEIRRRRKLLNFQDLLVEAARLLRENPDARRELQSRFTHLLVDEFQDTDPIQAEIIFLLSSDDPGEREWRRCVPRPGSLFLVGDPKQSIYRFRRADISIYNEVRDILLGAGGEVVNLSANFRSLPELVRWVNSVFSPCPDGDEGGSPPERFPDRATEFSPTYVELVPFHPDLQGEGIRGLYRLTIPEEYRRNEDALAYNAERIADFIAGACERGLHVYRRGGRDSAWSSGPAEPSDFLVLTYKKDELAVIAEKLGDRGIPCKVSGGESLNRMPELRLLYLCLRAALRPEDPIYLLAVLRSELFGISDADLYAFKKAGGTFSYRAPVPPGLDPALREAFEDAFGRLDLYRRWFYRLPLLAALERVIDDLGLLASAALRPGGDTQAGSLAKALEIIRDSGEDIWSTTQILERLERLVENRESYDGISALSEEPPAVRVMNLHKAKGLEAPVVFLAGVSRGRRMRVERHVERSPEGTRGYLALFRIVSQHQKKLIAHPEGWENLEARELKFLEAEDLRLRYVAATRASSACVITVKSRDDSNHPWRSFAIHLEGVPELPEHTPRSSKGPAPWTSPPRIEEFVRSSAGRREAFLEPTYQVVAARDLALSLERKMDTLIPACAGEIILEELPMSPIAPSGVIMPAKRPRRERLASSATSEEGRTTPVLSPPEPPPSVDDVPGEGEAGDGAQGPDFGEVVHLLLQAAAEDPSADLSPLATELLKERDLDPGMALEACALAEKVMGSPLWSRALAGSQRLVEVPFHFLEEKLFPIPTLVRGVVDLAFREEDGWVLVDYKTDRAAAADPLRTARRYAPQLLLYAAAWERIVGERVKEVIIHLADAGISYRLKPAGRGGGESPWLTGFEGGSS
ncbi:MAG: UvrD-helicase domain-containing protein [Actinomycetota bacterium]